MNKHVIYLSYFNISIIGAYSGKIAGTGELLLRSDPTVYYPMDYEWPFVVGNRPVPMFYTLMQEFQHNPHIFVRVPISAGLHQTLAVCEDCIGLYMDLFHEFQAEMPECLHEEDEAEWWSERVEWRVSAFVAELYVKLWRK